MLGFMFGERAGLVGEASPERLVRWCEAFEGWLEERRRNCHASTYRAGITAWKRLLGRVAKAPWEISQGDVLAYATWLQEEGLAPSTIRYELSTISSFYRWCCQMKVDPEMGEGFNPTEGVPRPKVRHYANAKVLNHAEARALLAILKMDEAILAKRDYAFFLARLRVGVALKKLQQLRWGQIENGEDGILVDWGGGDKETRRQGEGETRREGDGETRRRGDWETGREGDGENGGRPETAPLHEEVYEAIVAYLRVSGRLEGMRPEAYIFAPLVNPLRKEPSGRAEDWDESRHLGSGQIKQILKTYGRLAGVPEEKLTLPALRHTAAMLRLEAGDSPEALQAFLDCTMLKVSKNYLSALPPAGAETSGLRDLEKDPPELPDRKRYVFRSWEGMTHGMWAKRQPPEAVVAVLAESVRGMDDEITGLRMVNRVLLEMQERATDRVEVALLSDAYTLAAARLSEMITADEKMKKSREKGNWAEEFLGRLARRSAADGDAELYIEREKARALGRGAGLAVNARRLAEEIAGTRVALRRTFQMVMECEDGREKARLAGIYGNGCNRLVRLLKLEGDEQSRLRVYLNEAIDRAITEIYEEWGLK